MGVNSSAKKSDVALPSVSLHRNSSGCLHLAK